MTCIGELIAQPPVEHRRELRRIVNMAGYARETQGQVFKVHIENVSRQGCLIRGSFQLEADSRVWLKIPGLPPRAAKIAWSEEDRAGCAFESPLEGALVGELAAIGRRAALSRSKVLRDKLRGYV